MWKTHKRTIVLTLAAVTQPFSHEENFGNLYSAGGEFSRIRRLISLFPGESSDFLRESPFFVDFISVYMLQ